MNFEYPGFFNDSALFVHTRKNDSVSELNEKLVDQINQGNERAFKKLFISYYKPLCEHVYRYTSRTYIAEEIVQEVFTYVWENRQNWQPLNINAWLYKVSQNKALDYIKHCKVKEKNSFFIEQKYYSSAEKIPDQYLHLKNFENLAQKAIEQLPNRCRTTYVLHRWKEFSYAEIADIMNVSQRTVESQMSRALKLIRAQLKAYL